MTKTRTGQTATDIGHVTPQIAIKRYLVNELAKWIEEDQLSGTDAASKLCTSQERISHILARQETKFSIDRLVTLLVRAGRHVCLEIS